jgi:hypothetical protein
MRRFFLPFLFFTLTLLAAQEGSFPEGPASETRGEESKEAEEFNPVPLVMILEGIRRGEPVWRPDWPPDFPPDGFRLRKGEFRSLGVKRGDGELRFGRGTEEGERDFPFFVDGALVQGRFFYDEVFRVRGISADGWDLEILAYDEGLPSLGRMRAGDGWYFTGLKRRGNRIFETWYDEAGGILTLRVYEILPEGEDFRVISLEPLLGPEPGVKSWYYFDSRGLLSALETGEERLEALYYREGLPRYRGVKNAGGERRFSFQWDEEGFLTRISSSPDAGAEPGEGEAGEEEPAECRYEYTLDERGNWIERREIRMFRRRGLLVPSPGEVVTRIIDYGESE